MYVKKVSVIVIVLLFVSCNSVVDTEDDISNKGDKLERQERLDDVADQQRVNQLSENISADNYSQTVSELSAIYAKRMRILGQNARSADDMTNKTFSVWPRQAQTKPDELQKEISSQLQKFQAKARMLKAKGGKPVTAFDVMLDSKQADTTFSDIEKQYFRDIQKIFDKRHQEATYYSSKLRNLERTYQDQYELNEKEYLLITGVSQSVSTYLDILSQTDISVGSASHTKNYKRKIPNRIGISDPLPNLSPVDRSPNCPYSDQNGEFQVDWGLIVGYSVLGAASGVAGGSFLLAGSTLMFGPPGTGLALFWLGGAAIVGAGRGALGQYWNQQQGYERCMQREWEENGRYGDMGWNE